MLEVVRRAVIAVAIAAGGVFSVLAAHAQQLSDYRQTGDGLTVYLGIPPAAMVNSHAAMHDGARKGPHDYHIVAAVFDAASRGRISDATVRAGIAGLDMPGCEANLEPMKFTDTTTCGGFVQLPGTDLYTIRRTIQRASQQRPVVVTFKYDDRRE